MRGRSFAFCFIVLILLLVSPIATILSQFKLEAVPPAGCSAPKPMSTGPPSPRIPLEVTKSWDEKPGEYVDTYPVLLVDEAYPNWKGQRVEVTIHWNPGPSGAVVNSSIIRTSTGQNIRTDVGLAGEGSVTVMEALMNFEDVEATIALGYNGDTLKGYSVIAVVYDCFDMRDDLRYPNRDAGDSFDTALDLPTLQATGYMLGTGTLCAGGNRGTDEGDYYYVFLEANENLTIKPTHLTGCSGIEYRVYDEYKALITYSYAGWANISVTSLCSQIVYIELLTTTCIVTYELELSIETVPPPPETYYPPMTLYGYYEGGNPTGEVMEDIYPVSCSNGQQFIARATYHGLPAPTLTLYDQNGTAISSIGIDSVTTYFVYTTSYGEAITEFGISSSRTMTYELSVYIVDRYDDFSDVDVGGNFDTAAEVTLGAYGAGYQSGLSNHYPHSVPFAGFIESTYIAWGTDDRDFYKVNVTAGKEFRVTIASTEIEEISVTIHNQDRLPTYVDAWGYPVAEEGPLTLSWTPDKDQTAYVSIHTGEMGGIYYIQFGEGEYSNEFTYEEHVFNFLVISNSTISNFNFTQPLKLVTFDLIGMEDTLGFCNVTIPTEFLGGPYTVTIDDETLREDYDAPTNETHAFVYFTYNHSSHTIKITATTVIPESPSFLTLPLFTVATLLAVIAYRRKHSV